MAVKYKDYYALLGVDKKASKDEIAKAYKKLARKSHPDLNQDDPKAEERFKEITEAYEVLKDDEKRRMYDTLGPNWQAGQHYQSGGQQFGGSFSGSGFSDFFEAVFGSGGFQQRGGFDNNPFGSYSSRPRRGQDVEAEIEISLVDALHGGSHNISLQGSSGVNTYAVNIPSGVREGARLRLAGKGSPSPNGGAAGDILLTVRYAKHPDFIVKGFDLTTKARIMPWQAVLGSTIRVSTLEGYVEVAVPKGTNSGSKLRVRGKGLGPVSDRGNLYIQLFIDAPKNISDKERELWEALALEHEEKQE